MPWRPYSHCHRPGIRWLVICRQCAIAGCTHLPAICNTNHSSHAPLSTDSAYTCAIRANGGASACDNTIRVPRRVAESRLLAGLHDELTAPERFEQFKREVRRRLDAERRSQRHRDRDRPSPALAARLHSAETERATLATRTEARTAKVADFLPRLAAD